jgi:phosphoheptose isomerase
MTLVDRVRAAQRVYLIGNGGSYANAGHIANDLLAVGVRAYTLDAASLTAAANDYGWEQAFVRWLRVVGEPGDLLIALSGSGTSSNILAACEEAEKIGMDVWREFGAAQGLNQHAAEEHQIWMGHRLRDRLGGGARTPKDLLRGVDTYDMLAGMEHPLP